MFDLRYHVASLAAVFLALVIGILVGVGISGPVDKGKTKLLEERLAGVQRQLDDSSKHSAKAERESRAATAFVNETYPALARNRLRGKQIAVVFLGSENDRGTRSAVNNALSDSGAVQLRFRRLKVPIDVQQIEAALRAQPAAAGLTGRSRLEDLGRALGEELVHGGETPLWDSLTEALVEERLGPAKTPADGVVLVRTVAPQRAATSRFLLGLYSGLASAGEPAVGVEQTDAAKSAIAAYRKAGLSTVDDIDTLVGRLALVLLLDGASPGQYGVKESAGGPLPPWPPRSGTGG